MNSQNMLHVHISHSPEQETREYLETLLDPNILLSYGPQIPTPAQYRILVNGRPSREELTASPELEALVIPFSGLPESTYALMAEFPSLLVYNLHHNAEAASEMAIALLLAAAKRIVPIDRTFRKLDWTPRYQRSPSILLEGRNALVLGYGAIGRRVSGFCCALGMGVAAIRKTVQSRTTDHSVEIYPAHELDRLLPNADVLMICLPDTHETRGMIGEHALSLLPPNAILVNIARGAIVDEEALYHCLQEGRLFAAGLDVWYDYPQNKDERSHKPPSQFPFQDLDNVVMSPHRAGAWERMESVRMEHLANLLNFAARGEAIPNRIDQIQGY